MFVTRLLAILKEKGITQKVLCADIPLSKNSIAYWRDNNTTPNEITVKAIADYLEVNPAYLKGETDQKEPLLVKSAKESKIDTLIAKLLNLSPENFDRAMSYIDSLLQENQQND